jgi:magnesium transporter
LLIIVDKYERLLTAVELTIRLWQDALLSNSSKKILIDVDTLSRQIILLRRYFWQIRDMVNFLLNTTSTSAATLAKALAGIDVTQSKENINKHVNKNTVNMNKDIQTDIIKIFKSSKKRI